MSAMTRFALALVAALWTVSFAAEALAMPDVKERLRNAGRVEPWIASPEEFAAQMRSEHARYAKLVKGVGAEMD